MRFKERERNNFPIWTGSFSRQLRCKKGCIGPLYSPFCALLTKKTIAPKSGSYSDYVPNVTNTLVMMIMLFCVNLVYSGGATADSQTIAQNEINSAKNYIMRHGVVSDEDDDGASITDASKEAIKNTFSNVPLPKGHKYEILYLFSTGDPEGNGRYTETRDAVRDGVYEASKAQGFTSDIVLTKIEVTDLSNFTESELQSIWNKVSTPEPKTYRIFIFGSFLLHKFTDEDVDKKYFAKSDDFMRLWYATKDLYNCNHDSNDDERGFMYNFAYLYRYTFDNRECVGDHHINNKPKTSSQSCETFKNAYNDAKTCRKARKLQANWDDKFCLDVAGGDEDRHSENIQLWECNEVSETWYLDESNKIMAGWNSNVCLNVVGNKPEANASNVQTAVDCDTNTDDYKERWWLGDDGKIRAWWDTSLCLDIAGTNAEKREANAQIWQCDEVTETW